jgi:hypothetical protein
MHLEAMDPCGQMDDPIFFLKEAASKKQWAQFFSAYGCCIFASKWGIPHFSEALP